jgi:glycosyltransferase involved in cell wall biosynthesis
MKLSILMPVYNEEASVERALKLALAVDYPCETEIVVVNDGSTDRTAEVLAGLEDPRLRVIDAGRNQGKGAAIRLAASRADGDYVVILDADLEYEAQDIPRLMAPVLERRTDVVYGSRQFGSHSAYSFWYVMGNKAVTLAANVIFNSYISDVETCFKLMPTKLYLDLDVRSNGFGMEAEITGKLLRRRIRPYEVQVSYNARSREEGKKITAWDGVEALFILSRERLRGSGVRSRRPPRRSVDRGSITASVAPVEVPPAQAEPLQKTEA